MEWNIWNARLVESAGQFAAGFTISEANDDQGRAMMISSIERFGTW